MSVEASRFSVFSGRTWGNAAHLQCLSSWILYRGCKHRLPTCQQWLRSAAVPLREETDYLGGQYYDRNYSTLFFPDTPQRAGRITACDCMESRERTTHLFTQSEIKRCRSFTPVRNHNSRQPKLLKWLMLRTRTSVSGDWITSRLSARAAW